MLRRVAKVTRRVGTETPWSEVGMVLLPTALPWTTDASRNIRNDTKQETTSDWARYWSEVVPTDTLPGPKKTAR